MTIRQLADPADARELLVASELPVDDLDDPAVTLFGAFDAGVAVGVVGLQACGDLGLLRSLAVAPHHRHRGIARQLCDHVIAESRSRAMPALWLLTTSAKDYFARHGFEVVARDEVPAGIRATAQFSSLCPASAIVMRRRASIAA